MDEFATASLFFNQNQRKETSKNFAEMIEQSEDRHNDFSGIESQISMGFIGSGALLHKDGVQNEYQIGAISPKVMHASVKPSDLMQS